MGEERRVGEKRGEGLGCDVEQMKGKGGGRRGRGEERKGGEEGARVGEATGE